MRPSVNNGLVARGLVIALGITGCALNPAFFAAPGATGGSSGPVYSATVQAFHRIPPGMNSYAFLPVKAQAGDLEYETYLDLARREFASQGWVEVDRAHAAAFVVIDYLLDQGRPYEVQVPVFGETGVASSTTTGTVTSYGGTGHYSGTTTYSPSFGITGWRTRSTAQYRRTLYVLAFDAREQVEGKARSVFQAKGVSEGTTQALSPVMPFLMKTVIGQIHDESGAIREYRSDR